jgi:hypothetical protein
MPPTEIGEDSQFTIPLRSLIGLIAGTAVAVSAYVNITQQLSEANHSVELLEERLSDMEGVMQASPLTPIKLQLENINTRLKFMEGKLNERSN